jgi:Kef-type K+ transport system membrane component KefB
MIRKLEDFVSGLLLPLFFASSGLKTDLAVLHGVASIGFLALFLVSAAIGKVGATFLCARLLLRTSLPPRHALALAFLMNTKGLGVLIVLNIARDIKVSHLRLFSADHQATPKPSLLLTCSELIE